MNKIFDLVLFFLGVNIFFLIACTDFKKNDFKLLTCHVYFKGEDDSFIFIFSPPEKSIRPLKISKNAQKVYWDDCEIIIKEKQEYLVIDINNLSISTKRFTTYKSLEDFFYQTHGTVKKLKLTYCSSIYDALP